MQVRALLCGCSSGGPWGDAGGCVAPGLECPSAGTAGKQSRVCGRLAASLSSRTCPPFPGRWQACVFLGHLCIVTAFSPQSLTLVLCLPSTWQTPSWASADVPRDARTTTALYHRTENDSGFAMKMFIICSRMQRFPLLPPPAPVEGNNKTTFLLTSVVC